MVSFVLAICVTWVDLADCVGCSFTDEMYHLQFRAPRKVSSVADTRP